MYLLYLMLFYFFIFSKYARKICERCLWCEWESKKQQRTEEKHKNLMILHTYSYTYTNLNTFFFLISLHLLYFSFFCSTVFSILLLLLLWFRYYYFFFFRSLFLVLFFTRFPRRTPIFPRAAGTDRPRGTHERVSFWDEGKRKYIKNKKLRRKGFKKRPRKTFSQPVYHHTRNTLTHLDNGKCVARKTTHKGASIR